MYRAVFLLLVLGTFACGRDAPTSPLSSGDNSNEDASFLPVDTGLRFDSGSRPDFGFNPFDAGIGPDFGFPPFDGGAPPDFGFPPLDSGFPPDFGFPQLDAGSRPDFGFALDAGSRPDSGFPFDTGVRPDFGFPPFDGGAPPDIGGFDLGSPDVASPDGGGLCPGNTCSAAIVLRGQVGLETVTGNTLCATDNSRSSCSASGANDVVHQLRVSNRRRVVVRANSIRGGFLGALSLRRLCAVARSEIACDSGGSSGLASLDTFVDPGTYYLWLDGAASSARGSYRLDVEIDPQNTCADPLLVTLPAVGGSVQIDGDTTGAADTFQASCAGSARSPDHVVSFSVATRSRLTFETQRPNGTQFDTALHLRQACRSGLGNPEIACDDDGGTGTLSRLSATLNPGTYHLVVDGFATRQSGAYRLVISRQAAPPRVRFPLANDNFQTSTSSVFRERRDSVEGTRSPAGSSSTSSVDVELGLSNNTIGCGTLILRVSINGQTFGSLPVRSGDRQVQRTFRTLRSVSPPYRVRYEAANSLPRACGSTGLDLTNSFITFNR